MRDRYESNYVRDCKQCAVLNVAGVFVIDIVYTVCLFNAHVVICLTLHFTHLREAKTILQQLWLFGYTVI